MKCELCKSAIEELFLGKLKGTIIKDSKGKKHNICFDCQHKFVNDKQKMLGSL